MKRVVCGVYWGLIMLEGVLMGNGEGIPEGFSLNPGGASGGLTKRGILSNKAKHTQTALA